jgi:hypothetical protein
VNWCRPFLGLVELLLLQHRQVHRHVAAEGHGHGLDHMHRREPGVIGLGQGDSPLHHRIAFFGKVDGDQNVLVGHERLLRGLVMIQYGPNGRA